MAMSLKKERITLLDLPDALLVKIMEQLQDVESIVRCEAVSKRFNTLPHLPRRLEMIHSGKVGPTEDDLLRFLKAVIERGAAVEHLSVTYEDSIHPDCFSWVPLVSATLESLTLDLVFFGDDLKPFLENLCLCTRLVELRVVSRDSSEIDISMPDLEAVVASCSKLRVLILDTKTSSECFEHLHVVSSSLEQVHLLFCDEEWDGSGFCVTLETPALTDLAIVSANRVSLESHALRRLRLGYIREFIVSSLSTLDLLAFEYGWSLSSIVEVFRKISGGCVDRLLVNHCERLEDTDWIDLGEFLEPLTKLRSFAIGNVLIKVFASSSPFDRVREVFARLGVEEVVARVNALYFEENATVQAQHLLNTVLLLQDILRHCSSIRLVIDHTTSHTYPLFDQSARTVLENNREIVERFVCSLRDEFPGRFSELY